MSIIFNTMNNGTAPFLWLIAGWPILQQHRFVRKKQRESGDKHLFIARIQVELKNGIISFQRHYTANALFYTVIVVDHGIFWKLNLNVDSTAAAYSEGENLQWASWFTKYSSGCIESAHWLKQPLYSESDEKHTREEAIWKYSLVMWESV